MIQLNVHILHERILDHMKDLSAMIYLFIYTCELALSATSEKHSFSFSVVFFILVMDSVYTLDPTLGHNNALRAASSWDLTRRVLLLLG